MSAVQQALHAVQAHPRSGAAWAALGIALRDAGQLAPAVEAFQQSVRHEPAREGFVGWAACVLDQGALPQAVGILTVAWQRGLLRPDDVLTLAQLAMDAGDLDAAARVLADATTRWPGSAQGWLLRAINDTRRGRAEQAGPHLERARAIEPENADIHANLAAVQETLSDLSAAEASARRSLELDPNNAVAVLTLARLHRRAGDPQAALARLEALDPARLAPHHAARRLVELGHCRDKLGDPGGAWRAFCDMNRAAARRPAVRPGVAAAWSASLDRILAHAPALAAAATRPWTPPADGRAPVFIVGFPRSGTTLLEAMLGAHPALQATDEMPVMDIFIRRWGELLPALPAYPEGLLQLTPLHRHQLRIAWLATLDEVRPELDRSRRVIDKVPLSLVHLPLLHAIFPESPKIVLLRDPRDTALSCFMQDFAPGATNNLMMDMDSIVHVQARAFAVFDAVRDTLGPALQVVRYEDLVDDHLAVVRPLIQAAGLPWDPAVARYREGLVGAHITTPSYTQVVRPVHAAARERWRRYAEHLAPWREQLDQTAVLLGYSAD